MSGGGSKEYLSRNTSNSFSTIVTTIMKFLKKKVLKCLRVEKIMGLGILRPATLHQVIAEFLEVGILIPATIPLVIAEDMLVYMNLGHKRPSALPLAIGGQYLMLKVKVHIGLRPRTIPPITKMNMLYF